MVRFGRLTMKNSDPAMATGATIHTAGQRNLRSSAGLVTRSTRTLTATSRKASRVPALDSSAISSSLKKPAITATKPPVRKVTSTGVCLPDSLLSLLGSRPSRHHEQHAGLTVHHHQDD